MYVSNKFLKADKPYWSYQDEVEDEEEEYINTLH